jgi:hypothetical protein
MIEGFTVEVERGADARIWVRYHIDAPVKLLELGKPEQSGRRDQLWQTTCFEAFVRSAGEEGYCEYNFAPSGQWAAYHFDRCRSGMAELPMPQAPEMGNDASETHFALEAIFTLPPGLADAQIDIALTAVVEETDGTKSYWSLNHPPGAPDFHHRDCFALTLPAPARS